MLLRDVLTPVERRYPPASAQPWDAVGLVLGDPDQEVRRVLLAVDPVEEVAAEAIALGADLLVVHHPLYLRGVHGFAATTPKGWVAHALSRAGVALYVAHTNADDAPGGVSEALARAVGLEDLAPLVPSPAQVPLDVVVAYVPREHTHAVREALAAAGAGAIGAYDGCAWSVEGEGTFRPGPGANPTVGTVGELAVVREDRLEMVAPRARRDDVVAALRAAHPYEEPAFHVLEVTAPPRQGAARGTGRVGRLPAPTPLAEFARQVAAALPATAQGVRVAGDGAALVSTVAVCGGSGDAFLGEARAAGVDVYLTADLRHHPASEFRSAGQRPFLLDAAHWASEWPWLPVLAEQIRADAAAAGTTVEIHVSTTVTDAWTARVGGASD
ncbi:protein of unknown function DUF34 [Beutenbergia cavernae DSM 12333]|uniref:GTP cyclohydrolase 1 type 2 homolog n=1 Tax=Beutenbergia cavernae (strain ATCC BAA-8 / DSM 12333 / CCUG 43141 / JCM 11478 / NBRC 16432 / NCIMB 13614 / HKI 0122) TaxID=471853 RepID=C5C4V6_BEUC1|nr:Nif3-like dinuclear metal center hexameric protein [Beutenbergia cavernae]ACQ80084.1 protein of unknown function DUF34 [Beutenbergia cavernae DSM 12333]